MSANMKQLENASQRSEKIEACYEVRSRVLSLFKDVDLGTKTSQGQLRLASQLVPFVEDCTQTLDESSGLFDLGGKSTGQQLLVLEGKDGSPLESQAVLAILDSNRIVAFIPVICNEGSRCDCLVQESSGFVEVLVSKTPESKSTPLATTQCIKYIACPDGFLISTE